MPAKDALEVPAVVPDSIQIWDYLSIQGDFDGDGVGDTLTEHVINTITGQETNKYYNVDSYDSAVVWTMRRMPLCQLRSSVPGMKPLKFFYEHGQLFGLGYLNNEGDLNQDGGDEIGLILDWADWSSVNTYHVFSHADTGWREVLAFEVRDWELRTDSIPEPFLQRGAGGEFVVRTYDGSFPGTKQVYLR